MSMYETIKRANLPGPPEHSIALRVSSAGAVVVSIAACWAQGELSGLVASLSIVLIIVGNVFSYLRRERQLHVYVHPRRSRQGYRNLRDRD